MPKLPPMLNMHTLNPISSCSKASRGLFVQPWVKSIFTPLAISPSPSLRQSSSRYAIRAGRNSPDKEFRYLRTVIVTAGVHPRFGSRLAPLPLTFGHWPGISPYTSACAFAGTCVFDKQSLDVFCCIPHLFHLKFLQNYRLIFFSILVFLYRDVLICILFVLHLFQINMPRSKLISKGLYF